MGKFLTHVERFRSGGGFLASLSLLLVLWFATNHTWHFDPENLTLNLILSIEAAYAMPVLLMANAKRASEESERLKAVLAATHELLHTLKNVAEDVDQIEERLDDEVC